MRMHAAVGRGNFILRSLAQKSFTRLFGILFLFVLTSFPGCAEGLASHPGLSEKDSGGGSVFLASPAPATSRQCIWQNVDKVIAIGDLHGDYKHFVTILQDEKINLVDEKLNWIGGKTHLVQIGDVMDRGEHAKDIFDLIKKLEKQAAAAGGMVHMLIGNHEEINIMEKTFDYPDYLTVAQLKDFVGDAYKKKKEKEFEKKIGKGGDTTSQWKELITTADPEAMAEYFEFFNTYYGRWIAEEHNAVIKINDTVFVHGGINEKYSAMKLQEINNLYYTEFLRVFRGESFRTKILFDPDGPLWFRDLATWSEQLYSSEVDKILANLWAHHMVVAHTPFIQDKLHRFGERVWLIDTGISSLYHGFLSALIIENGNFTTWRKNYAS